MELVLASASPRRRELLALLGLRFRVAPAGIDESPGREEPAADLAERLACAKAAAADTRPALAADTVVAIAGAVLGKPGDPAAGKAMLERLSGSEHEVYTAVALAGDGGTAVAVVRTRVWFRNVDAVALAAYAVRPESLAAAGAYAIQGGASAFVSRIVGSYSNVVGLPLAETARLLAVAGLLQ